MNKINRAVVKQQAKNIIKGKIFYLFLISTIVSILAGASLGGGYNVNVDADDFELFRQKDNQSSSDSGGFSQWDNPIENFEFNGMSDAAEITELSVAGQTAPQNARIAGVNSFSLIASIIFLPLTVTLMGMYLSLVRRSPDEQFNLGKELGGIFKNTFNDTYLKKLVLVILKFALCTALCMLFVIPGIIFMYSSYFAERIMCDNPNLKPSEAIKLSKKIIKGNRSELFALDLSFLGWLLLCILSFGIVSIYVVPYLNTTRALYYENFRMRALQEGRITADDFLTFEEKMKRMAQDNVYGDMNNTTTDYRFVNPQPQPDNANSYYYAPQANNQPPVVEVQPVETSPVEEAPAAPENDIPTTEENNY